jgi:hypothetical protein
MVKDTLSKCYYCESPAVETVKWAGETYRVCHTCRRNLEWYTGLDLEVANE